jgi:outer membrane protein assembly factor BamB
MIAHKLLPLLALTSITNAADWPNWRGPNHDGSTAEKGLPSKITPGDALWKVTMPGPAASTPVVSGDKVFVSTTDAKAKKLLGLCLDRKTGKELWRRELGSGFSADERSNYANPSPVTDSRTVIFHFATGDTAAFDFTGKELWKRNLQQDYGTWAIQWTPASSPVITKDLAIFQVLQRDSSFEFGGQRKGVPGSPNESYLLALDPATGKEKWKSIRPSDAVAESRESFSTPMPWSGGGREELLVSGGDCLSGHSLTDGKELWRTVSWNPEKIGHWRLVPGPVAGDGIILGCAPKRAPIYAVKAGATGTVTMDDMAWITGKDTDNEDVSSDVSTPLFYQGRFYVLNSDRKSLSCVEPKSGKLIWEHRVEGGAKIESSPTAGDGRIYFQDMRANVTIMAAGDEPKVVFSGSMADGAGEEKDVRSSIALAGGCAFVRTTRVLYCVGSK